ncbi:serine/threonine protein kinase, bacterial [Phycisphaerales bacterium]|nr:serine/threonine protein kinase, bacterial [Phycisphaerales bacterium]
MPDEMVHFKANDLVEGLRIDRELGQGAASVVYLAHDPKSRQVYALKHVHRGSSKDDRFLRQAMYEYKVASRLDHPNIRRIHRLDKKARMFVHLTDVFLVMEMLDGVSMDRKLPKTFDDAITIFLQTADALKHMHSRGFVHADMKPNNIMVVTGVAGPISKIIDLGQSCEIGTVKQRIQGTPDYIAPEQVHRRAITERTDVYNLGATMYYVLTGKTVPSALSTRPDALVNRLDDELIPKAPPAVGLNPRIPPKLNELIMHCIEINPEDRPMNMTFVIESLQFILGQVRYRNEQSGSGSSQKPNNASAAGFIYNDGSGGGVKVPDSRAGNGHNGGQAGNGTPGI